ncbi:MAG: glycosyltransferase family 2 protein [Sphaerochaetaceae bacterium]|jgi:glycosyltransferase involved in cell wall biosynthesis|nr:glycosyltransferase family 2 protein [Sphaerochaetaceae bacterium]
MVKKTLTIFTPTYNRAYTLSRCYNALKNQTSLDFVWLVIDDGSTDETAELIRFYQRENEIEIVYYYQENMGMHGAHNAGIRLADSLLWTICDSDDYFSENAVEKIIDMWRQKGDPERHAGLICKISDQNGNSISEFLPDEEEVTTYELNYTRAMRCDFRPIYLLSAVNQDFFPILNDEHYMPCGYKYIENEGNRKLLVINEALYHVEFLSDGCTTNKVKQFFTYPIGFLFVRTKMLGILREPKTLRRGKIQYLASCIIARQNMFRGALGCPDVLKYLIPAYLYYIRSCLRYKKQYKHFPHRKANPDGVFDLIRDNLGS